MDMTVDDKVANALIQGVRYGDYSHWNRINTSTIQYAELDIGCNYRIVVMPAIPCHDEKREYSLSHKGSFALVLRPNERNLTEDGLQLKSENCEAFIHFSKNVSLKQDSICNSARRFIKKPNKLDYWGIKEDDSIKFNEDLIDTLMVTTLTYDFDGLKKYESAGNFNAGPASIRFNGISKAKFPSHIGVDLTDDGRTPVSLKIRGFITPDSEGVAIIGENASYTIIITDDDWKKFYDRHPDILTTAEYIEKYPPLSHNDVVGDREEEIRKII